MIFSSMFQGCRPVIGVQSELVGLLDVQLDEISYSEG
jgi:hypothetical protein